MSTFPGFRLATATMEDITIVDVDPDGTTTSRHTLTEPTTSSVAIDPLDPDRIIAGTFDRSAWLTRDGGRSWSYIGHGIHSTHVSAVAMSPARQRDGSSAIYVGTEPANLYRSEDDGMTWEFFPSCRSSPAPARGRFRRGRGPTTRAGSPRTRRIRTSSSSVSSWAG